MEKIKIRTASMEDLDEITDIEAICFPQAEAAGKESFRQRLELFGTSFKVAVAEDEAHISNENESREGRRDGARRLIEFINGSVSDAQVISDEMFEQITYNDRGDYQMVFGLDVLPEYRRQGIGELLMNALIKQAWEDGRRGLVLTCKEGLIHYYEHFGYENQGLSKSVHGGAVWYDMMLTF